VPVWWIWNLGQTHIITEHTFSASVHSVGVKFKNYIPIKIGTRDGAVVWGTAIQAGRSRAPFPTVSLEIFIDIILPPTLWLRCRLSVKQKWVPCVYSRGKGGRHVGLKHYHLHVPNVLKCGLLNLLEPSTPVQACTGSATYDLKSIQSEMVSKPQPWIYTLFHKCRIK